MMSQKQSSVRSVDGEELFLYITNQSDQMHFVTTSVKFSHPLLNESMKFISGVNETEVR